MTLEDFFSVSEMKHGLTSSARVKELVNAMLVERDSVSKNAVDVTRQWSTIASTIAATEDKECLDLFVQLDGVSFITKWLEDTQKLSNEHDSSAEESIIALLLAVEKLRISYEQSLAYGIRVTVEKILSYNSVRVQEKAKALFDSWKQPGDGDASTGIGDEGVQTMSGAGDNYPSIGVTQEEKHFKTGDDLENKCANVVLVDKIDDIEMCLDNEEKDLHDENMKDEDSTGSKPFQERDCNEGEYMPCHLEVDASNTTSIAVVPKEDGMVSNQSSSAEEQKQEVAIPLDRSSAIEISPSSMGKNLEPVIGSDLQTNTVTEVDKNLKESATGDERMDSSSSSSMDDSLTNVDGAAPDQYETMTESQNLGEDSVNESRSQILESPENSTSGDSDSNNDDEFFKTIKGDYDVVNNNRSDFDLSYGICDALEVARQVANEVEREVEGQREPSSNSSQENTVEPREPDSPASVHGSSSNEDSPKEGEVSKDLNVSIVKQENESKPDKGVIDFDLNQEICSGDTDQPLDMLPTPVSIVSASRAAAAPGFPESPLQFEGAHGWKGSALTSAFRAASPRKIHDSDKFENNLNNRQNFLDFDLNNMSEEGDNKAAELLFHKQILHSGESSGEAKLNLDLNRVSDEGDPQQLDWRLSERLLLSRNGHHNASPSTSSSSMQQPSRNFDLNDQPSFFNDSSEVNLKSASQKLHSFLVPRSSNNVISIMGTKVEVNRKDFSPHPPFLPNGRILEPATDANLTRNGGSLGIRSPVPYPYPNMFMYNGLTTGPTGPFSPVMYGPGGPIPYMVDSRGAAVVPQLLGSAPYSQTPFAAANSYGMHPPGLYGPGPGPSRPTFELNLGLMGERVNRESGGLRQFLGPGPNQSLDDFRSVGIGKRKEPDGGWEPYPFDYKHQYPQWR